MQCQPQRPVWHVDLLITPLQTAHRLPVFLRTRGVFILDTESDFRRRSATKAFRTNNPWLRTSFCLSYETIHQGRKIWGRKIRHAAQGDVLLPRHVALVSGGVDHSCRAGHDERAVVAAADGDLRQNSKAIQFAAWGSPVSVAVTTVCSSVLSTTNLLNGLDVRSARVWRATQKNGRPLAETSNKKT